MRIWSKVNNFLDTLLFKSMLYKVFFIHRRYVREIEKERRKQDLNKSEFSGDPIDFARKTMAWLHLVGFPDVAYQVQYILSQHP